MLMAGPMNRGPDRTVSFFPRYDLIHTLFKTISSREIFPAFSLFSSIALYPRLVREMPLLSTPSVWAQNSLSHQWGLGANHGLLHPARASRALTGPPPGAQPDAGPGTAATTEPPSLLAPQAQRSQEVTRQGGVGLRGGGTPPSYPWNLLPHLVGWGENPG